MRAMALMKVKVLISHVQLFATLWSVTHQAPLSMEFSRQEYCSVLPCPSPGDFPNSGIKLAFHNQIFCHLSHQRWLSLCGKNLNSAWETRVSLPHGWEECPARGKRGDTGWGEPKKDCLTRILVWVDKACTKFAPVFPHGSHGDA